MLNFDLDFLALRKIESKFVVFLVLFEDYGILIKTFDF